MNVSGVQNRPSAAITSHDISVLNRVLKMEGGWVLDFNDCSFAEFFKEHGVDIEDRSFYTEGPSKAKRMRSFLKQAEPSLITRVLSSLWEFRLDLDPDVPERDAQAYKRIVYKLGGHHQGLNAAAEAVLVGKNRDSGPEKTGGPDQALEILSRIAGRLPDVAEVLRNRKHGRQPFLIEVEYDVQDLLHALLRVQFDHVRAEEWNPSYAGSSTRMDFFLDDHATVVEVKKMRPTLTTTQLVNELIIDISRYRLSRPEIQQLVCLVYDPGRAVKNPRVVVKDLEQQSVDGFRVKVLIVN